MPQPALARPAALAPAGAVQPSRRAPAVDPAAWHGAGRSRPEGARAQVSGRSSGRSAAGQRLVCTPLRQSSGCWSAAGLHPQARQRQPTASCRAAHSYGTGRRWPKWPAAGRPSRPAAGSIAIWAAQTLPPPAAAGAAAESTRQPGHAPLAATPAAVDPQCSAGACGSLPATVTRLRILMLRSVTVSESAVSRSAASSVGDSAPGSRLKLGSITAG